VKVSPRHARLQACSTATEIADGWRPVDPLTSPTHPTTNIFARGTPPASGTTLSAPCSVDAKLFFEFNGDELTLTVAPARELRLTWWEMGD
jgi:hypothetical protein